MRKMLAEESITGMSISDVMTWIEQSWTSPGTVEGALTLPPLQRNGVWRPKQVLDLWRSVLDGLPIGLFYLQKGCSRRPVIAGFNARTTTNATTSGFDLVDGQQRIRTLALGRGLDEDRCLWVKFKEQSYTLRLTSRAQPFGYAEDGSRLRTAQRRRARETIEPEGTRLNFVGSPPEGRNGTKVYDSDLFQHDVSRGAETLHHPPFPFECDRSNTASLNELFSAYRFGGKQALTDRAGPQVSPAAVEALARGFENLSKKGAAFMVLEKEVFQGNLLSDFFRRVGAGGTPLSEAEQLYSAFKAVMPEVRDIVEGIQQNVTAVFTPAQIMTTVLRIANTQAGDRSGWSPGFPVALAAIRGEGKAEEKAYKLRGGLNRLLTYPNGEVGIHKAFQNTKSLLSEGPEPFRLSDIVLAQLRPELWQVLVFWCHLHPGKVERSRQEAVRLAMFWHFGVNYQESAARLCFAQLAELHASAEIFPGYDLYRKLVDDGTAVELVQPEVLRTIIQADGPSPKWVNHNQRFPQGVDGVQTAIQWWYAVHMLPWLQRVYLDKSFPGYMPLTEHKDDLPYDRDHICARAHWRPDERGGTPTLRRELLTPMKDARNHLGDAIGNYRLIGSSENRADGAVCIAEKAPFLFGLKNDGGYGTPEDFCLDYDTAMADWKSADGAEREWPDSRLQGFQTAVVNRTTVLYCRYFDVLEYGAWVEKKAKSPVAG